MVSCPDCRTHKVYVLGMLMMLTVTLAAILIFDYMAKASSIEEYNNLVRDCNRLVAEANKQIAKCAAPVSGLEGGQFPALDRNCSVVCEGGPDGPD